MSDGAVPGQAGGWQLGRVGQSATSGRTDHSVIDLALGGAARLYPVPRAGVTALLVAGAVLGALGDLLLQPPDPPGLNLSVWIASVAVAALMLRRRAAVDSDVERVTWLAIGVVCAAGFAWRDAPVLRLLSLGSATLTFALAAYRPAASWVRRTGVVTYAAALALGALHAWTAAALAFADARLSFPRSAAGRTAEWRTAAAVARGLAIAAPLVVVFGALFVSADAVFADLVANVFRFDFDWIAHHLLLFSVLAWIATGYLRGFLTGTAVPPPHGLQREGAPGTPATKRPALAITEAATALTVLDLLFLLFVAVQLGYLFGDDTLVQVTPELTYAEYARRGFFELVFAVFLVVPVLLAADWLFEPRRARDVMVFRGLAGVQIALVLAIGVSAVHRLRLYHASYGFTETRFYAMVLLVWIGAMLLWLAATVLRGRRESFAFGTLTSGLATLALLFVINPDATVARANVTRLETMTAAVRFDVAYAASLSADAVPVLIEALPVLPRDVQCPLARHILRRWPPDRHSTIRNWNWSVARASDAVRQREALLRSMVLPGLQCPAPTAG